MYYWSRWTNIPTIENADDEAREKQPSWRDTAPRLTALRETRLVVVVTRNRTQPQAASYAYQPERFQERDTDEGITLDIQRSRYASRALTPASQLYEATTQPVLEAFRIK